MYQKSSQTSDFRTHFNTLPNFTHSVNFKAPKVTKPFWRSKPNACSFSHLNSVIFAPTILPNMDFSLTEEQIAIQRAAKDFAIRECLPGVIERDEKQQLPREQLLKLAELGFMGMMVSPENGGAGMDTVSYVLAMEEISKIDASVSVAMSVNNSLVCWGLEAFGSVYQKDRWLRHLAAGKKDGELYIGAFLLSEPEAGSDATSQKTKAVDKGDYYL